MTPTLQVALNLRSAGISTIPVKADKRPTVEWRKYQNDTPTESELTRWFSKDSAIALIAGKVQCLDFDEKYSQGIFGRFCIRSEEVGLDYLLGELIRQKTPSGGFHLVWQCDGRKIKNLKLAEKSNHECMIETRGDGGYFLISPSANYTLESGDWSSIPTISEEDRDALLSLARSFDERPPAEAVGIQSDAPSPLGNEITPGDDYDFRADLPALLRSHGWKHAGGSGKYWTRPGKDKGISASWDVVPGRLWVFSSSTEFEPNHVYRPWHVYAVLECGGDFSRAASELRRQGFGGAPVAKKKTIESAGIGEPPAIEGVDPHGNAPTVESEDDRIRRLLKARAFDPNKVPPPVRPVFTLGGIVICTPGNLTAITAQAKVGKSALVSAMTAAAMRPPEAEADCLTAEGYNAHGKALLYIDTEQSPDDFWHAVNRAKRRARVEKLPEWVRAHTIADLPAQIGRKALAIAMADYAELHGGVHSVIIDGVADLVLDVNDAEECNGFVAELHSLAIRYDCSIICVIHKNPGSDKTRGHLGSQIERKAETNLSMDKEDQVTVVWSEKQRRAPIEKKTGPRFRWDDELKMHVTASREENRPAAKVIELLDLAESVLKPGDSMTWKELVSALQEARSTPDKKPVQSTVDRWILAMKKAEILVLKFGSYQLNPKHRIAA